MHTYQQNGADCLCWVGHVNWTRVAKYFGKKRQSTTVVQMEMRNDDTVQVIV